MELDLGGDSTRLYFYDPISWLYNIGFNFINSLNSLGFNNPNFYMIPFLVSLGLLKYILNNNAYLLNCLFNGLLLLFSFLSIYLIIQELIDKKDNLNSKCCSIIGGLFFIFSPIIIYEWQKASYYFNYIAIYPLIFYFLIKFIKNNDYKYIINSLIITLIFSVNFSFATFPWFFSFFSFSFIFLCFYSIINNKTLIFLKGFSVFIVLFINIQSFQLIPQLYNIFDSNNSNSQLIFSKELTNDRGLNYFLSVEPYVKLIYNIINQPQYDISIAFNHTVKDDIYNYGIKYSYFFFLYIIIIVLYIIINNKNFKNNNEYSVFLLILLIYLVLLFFMTAHINDFLFKFYVYLFKIPGFSMFRSFYTKFGMPYIFYYSFLLGISLFHILNFINNKSLKRIIFILIGGIIIFNGWPLISGKIVNGVLWQSNNVKIPIIVDTNYLLYLDYIKNKKIDTKYLSLPLTNESYQVLKGSNDGAYFGPSFFAILTNKTDFNGIGSFQVLDTIFLKLLENKEKLNIFFSLLNIGYIGHNNDDYIYDNFSDYPYGLKLKYLFPSQKFITKFIIDLDFKKKFQIANFYLYNNNINFLPHFYTPIMTIKSPTNSLYDLILNPNYQIRSAIFFQNQNTGKNLEMPTINNTLPIIEFKKINPTKYRIILHKATGTFPLVFSESFHNGWKIYLKDYKKEFIDDVFINNYKILDGNTDDQANNEELQTYINNGYISTLSDGKEKSINHMKWENNKEKIDYIEKYNIDFISKNFNGTIQNDNLSNGNFYDTWFQKSLIEENNHLIANGYANSWIIDIDKICKNSNKCVNNSDGTYDFEMIIEFWPQRLFYLGLMISGTTFMIIIFYLIIDFIRTRKQKKGNIILLNLKN